MRIGYARVSTDDQSLDLQLDALRKAGCSKIYRDHGISGCKTDRPALAEALCSLAPGDTLVCWRLDRLGRSLSHLISIVADMERRSIRFVSLCEAIDTQSATGRLLFHIMGALAEFERSLISERTRAGLAAARARGVRVGRPLKLQAEELARAAVEVAQGLAPMHSISARYGVSVSTLMRGLARSEPVRERHQVSDFRSRLEAE